ncbi:hypothetical protein AB0A74_38635 [Saccharothrix sp. NPDC042600]|uniref:hypothetical protein n=1 Tax=Saccharothrix TaxID=2071 RepID=UPI0033E796D9|nr:hypothetical protein GCM10017745_56770 [Saccharothrix mutabilis subsp. capreolus]
MVVFACARCGAPLTAPVSRVALPAHAHQHYGHELLPSLVEPGTYAVEPAHSGGPWRRWEEFSAEEIEARGVYAPAFSLPCGAPGAIAVAPGDTRGTVVIPERCDGYCMGLAGNDGPNLACAGCGREVGTRIDDCGYWQAVWLVPDAVRPVGADAPERPVAGWEEWARERAGIPPVDPNGYWDPRWEAAVGAALAHLLVAAEGRPVAVPDGLLTATFGPALAALLPKGPPERKVDLAGPGLTDRAPDIALVPRHPRTGEPWQPTDSTTAHPAGRTTAQPAHSTAARPGRSTTAHPAGSTAAQPAGSTTAQPAHSTAARPVGGAPPESAGGVAVVPLEAGVWAHLAFHQSRPLPPATGGVPVDVIRDDPLPPHTGGFRVDSHVFQHTLARLPAVREPWLRRIYDRVREHPYQPPF